MLLTLLAGVIIFRNLWVINSTKRFILHDNKKIEQGYDLAVVLGTSDRREDGSPNPCFDARIRTAAPPFFFKTRQKKNIEWTPTRTQKPNHTQHNKPKK